MWTFVKDDGSNSKFDSSSWLARLKDRTKYMDALASVMNSLAEKDVKKKDRKRYECICKMNDKFPAELFTYVVTEGRDYKLSNDVVQSIKTFCSMVYVHRMTISNIRRICEDISRVFEVQTKYFEALVNIAPARGQAIIHLEMI